MNNNNNFGNSGGYSSPNNSYPNMENMFGRTNQFEQQLQTNKWRVQNLQDALTRYAPPYSCGCYHCTIDGKEYEYDIYTDGNGNKSYKVFERIPCENATSPNVDISQLLDRISKLEEKLNVQSTPDSSNGVK